MQSDTPYSVPAPILDLHDPPPIEFALHEIRFDDSIEQELAGVIGSSSGPRLSRYQSVDIADFARQAHIALGRPKTVILVVNVEKDGFASSVNVATSCGDPLADRAAVAYALELRWVPATRNREPFAVRIKLPVTLIVRAQ